MKWLLVIIAFCMMTMAYAYTPADESYLMQTLQPGFQPLAPVQKTSSIIISQFGRTNPQTGLKEDIRIDTVKKPTNKTPEDIVKELYFGFQAAFGQGVELSQPVFLTQNNVPFKAWLISVFSKTHQISAFSLWIDADSLTFYMITYKVNAYLATEEERNAATALLKSSIQVCYQKNCYNVQ